MLFCAMISFKSVDYNRLSKRHSFLMGLDLQFKNPSQKIPAAMEISATADNSALCWQFYYRQFHEYLIVNMYTCQESLGNNV